MVHLGHTSPGCWLALGTTSPQGKALWGKQGHESCVSWGSLAGANRRSNLGEQLTHGGLVLATLPAPLEPHHDCDGAGCSKDEENEVGLLVYPNRTVPIY